MWCVVPAAGKGTRLAGVAGGRPKALLPVAGRPLLRHVLDVVPAAVSRLCVVLGPDGELVRRVVGPRHAGRPLHFVVQEHRLGVAHAVACARDLVEGAFLVVMGDVWYERPLDPLVETWRRSTADGAVLLEPVDPERTQPVGLVELEGDAVAGLEKRRPGRGDRLGVAGAMLLPEAAFGALEAAPSSRSGEYELEDAVERLLGAGRRFIAVRYGGWRRNVNTPEDLAAVEARIAAAGSRAGTRGRDG